MNRKIIRIDNDKYLDNEWIRFKKKKNYPFVWNLFLSLELVKQHSDISMW